MVFNEKGFRYIRTFGFVSCVGMPLKKWDKIRGFPRSAEQIRKVSKRKRLWKVSFDFSLN